MTARQLNRDVKRLKAAIDAMPDKDLNAFFEFIQNYCAGEFKRLYNADNSMESLNAESLRIMLRLNVKHRFIPFHQFGLFIKD